MFESTRTHTSSIGTAASILELIYHATVRHVRKSHGNAIYGLFMNVLQTALFVLIFYVMVMVLGMRSMAFRGDFLLYIMSGVFLFMTHIKSMAAVVGSDGPASAMMKHAPMTTAISITSSALGSLYIQILSACIVLFIYHAGFTPIRIHDPIGTIGMFLLAWASGVAIGLVFLASKPWAPDFVGLFSGVFRRANMIASGKMFVANSLPNHMLIYFAWNPLFHCIDQARGFIFVNYTPHNTSLGYPLYLTLALIMIGLMGEFFTRKHASASWNARQ